MKEFVRRFDQNVTQWVVSTFGQGARPFFEFVTAIGDPITVIAIAVVIGAVGLYQHSFRMVLAAASIPGTLLIGAFLKMLFERTRPISEYAMNMKIQTFSFPSGHSSGSTIAFGLLAYIAFVKLPAPWSYVAAAVLILVPIFVGLSRVYLGAHFPSDVVAGWLLGVVVLIAVITFVRPFV